MYLGKVVGCVWSTMKNKDLDGQRLLIVQPLTPELTNTGKRLICTDSTCAARIGGLPDCSDYPITQVKGALPPADVRRTGICRPQPAARPSSRPSSRRAQAG